MVQNITGIKYNLSMRYLELYFGNRTRTINVIEIDEDSLNLSAPIELDLTGK